LVRDLFYGGVCLQQHNTFISQQTHFFTNHDLYPKFDIEGVNKNMNPTSKK
jgi:hypothetical protein